MQSSFESISRNKSPSIDVLRNWSKWGVNAGRIEHLLWLHDEGYKREFGMNLTLEGDKPLINTDSMKG